MAPRALVPLLLAVATVTGCAAVYQPSAMNVASLTSQGDGQLAVHAGTPGVQLSGAYAVHDAIAIRGLLQTHQSETESTYFRQIAAGASWFGSRPLGEDESNPFSVAYGLSLDAGPFVGQGQVSLTIGSSTGTTTYRGAGFRSALQADVALTSAYFSIGAGARVAHLHFVHDEGSSRAGERAQALMVEPVIFIRPGAPIFKVDAQFGLAMPVWAAGDVGIPLPVVLALGGVLQF